MTEGMNFFILSAVVLFTASVLTGIAFSFPALHINHAKEAAKLLLVTRIGSLLAVLSPLVFCVFSPMQTLSSAMNLASVLYTTFAGMRLLVIAFGVLLVLFASVTRKDMKKNRHMRNLFYTSEMVACAVCAVLAWLTAS